MSLPNIPERERVVNRVLLCLSLFVIGVFVVSRFLETAATPPPPVPEQAAAPAAAPAPPSDPDKLQVSVTLHRGTFTFFEFPSKKTTTRAIIFFGSGDGGWRDDFEEKVGRALQRGGYEVIAIDSSEYAKTDYNLDILQSDYTTIAQAVEEPFGAHPPPLILGGYSMGAEQAIAAAGGDHPPQGVVGLLLISPESRGRYGLRTLDKIDIPPTGSGTFSMKDFAPKMGKLRIVQWHGGWDPTDSVVWLQSVTAEHKEFDYPNVWHDYNLACPDFLRQLIDSIDFILTPLPNGTQVGKNTLNS